ncbi:hypothetical protein, partial [Escherichia coli]|uniref:hypothetical protein n=1 Tax=Escherichia coli TaxID=562 RepID=UPI001A8F49BF
SLKTSIKTITYLSDTGCLEIQGASLPGNIFDIPHLPYFRKNQQEIFNGSERAVVRGGGEVQT